MSRDFQRLESIVIQIGEAVISTTETVERLAEKVEAIAEQMQGQGQQVQQQSYQIFTLSEAWQTFLDNQADSQQNLNRLVDCLQNLVVVLKEDNWQDE